VCFERIVPLAFTGFKAFPKDPPGVVILVIGIPGIFDAREIGLKL
jgi:hypothetical protein